MALGMCRMWNLRQAILVADARYNAQIHSIIVALSPHVLTLIKDLNHVIHKCLNKLAPEDNHLIYNAVAANSIVLRLRPTVTAAASFSTASAVHLIISASNLTGIETTLVPSSSMGSVIMSFIQPVRRVIRKFRGNVCALSVQKFSSNVIEKCMRAAEHSTLKTLIVELLSRTRLEKLLSDSYGNYCVQTVLDYAEPNQRALPMQGIWPVLPLIWKPPYGTRIYKKLQRDQIDQFGGGGYQHCESLVNIRGSRPGH
ncbi:armadillo-type protein [Mycena leptocephala]|nr:armadillo-type protein [Mycena leptocephala]